MSEQRQAEGGEQAARQGVEALRGAALTTWVSNVFDGAKRCRGQATEAKWERNYKLVEADPEQAEKWRNSEDDQTWKSRAVMDFARQKIAAAKGIGEDLVLHGRDIPFELQTAGGSGEQGAGSGEQGAVREALREAIRADLELTDSSGELARAWWHGAIYGESFTRLVEETVEGKDVFGVECVSPWECFRDPSHRELAAGRYFFRRRWLTAADLFDLRDVGGYREDCIGAAVEAMGRSGEGGEAVAFEAEPQAWRRQKARAGEVEFTEAWLFAPRGAVEWFGVWWGGEGTHEGLPNGGERLALEAAEEADQVWVMVMLADGAPVGWMREPGPLPYRRAVWEDAVNEIDGFGVADGAALTQHVASGLVKAIENNAKIGASGLIAVERGALRTRIEDALGEGKVLEFASADGDLRRAVQQFTFADMTAPLSKTLDLFLHLGDLSTQMPRVYQGQEGERDATAYELQQRIGNAGKYLLSVVRHFDAHIDAAVGWVCRSRMEAAGITGYAARSMAYDGFHRIVKTIERVTAMYAVTVQNPAMAARARWSWWIGQFCELYEIDAGKAFLTDEEVQAAEQAAAESEERQLETERLRAETARAAAAAEKAGAEAAAVTKRVDIELSREARAVRAEAAGREQGAGSRGQGAGSRGQGDRRLKTRNQRLEKGMMR